ncbi:uncharacterized protein [Channa argus]|uniref:uncharacterized protein isoform X2 n=1 Tax=Channa argus TaxID=215402 RepID=UPI00351FC911
MTTPTIRSYNPLISLYKNKELSRLYLNIYSIELYIKAAASTQTRQRRNKDKGCALGGNQPHHDKPDRDKNKHNNRGDKMVENNEDKAAGGGRENETKSVESSGTDKKGVSGGSCRYCLCCVCRHESEVEMEEFAAEAVWYPMNEPSEAQSPEKKDESKDRRWEIKPVRSANNNKVEMEMNTVENEKKCDSLTDLAGAQHSEESDDGTRPESELNSVPSAAWEQGDCGAATMKERENGPLDSF